MPISAEAAGPSLTMDGVRSYLYMNSSGTGTPGIYERIRNTPVDLIILGSYVGQPAFQRALADPEGTKLIVALTSLTLASAWQTPELLSLQPRPAWIGREVPEWPGTFSVQYWNPAWRQSLKQRIDQLIAEGYDGVFLDSANEDFDWLPGNRLGNPGFADASDQLGALIADVCAYVRARALPRPFYVIANGSPRGAEQKSPSPLAALDAIFVEGLYFLSTGAGGINTSQAQSAQTLHWMDGFVVPGYGRLKIKMLGNDYPQPPNDLGLALKTFQYYSELGWVPSVVDATDMMRTAELGPLMFMAVPSRPVVSGKPSTVNFLSGGVVPAATLIAGDQGDFLLGGPGTNLITGGKGDDTIYPHPRRAQLLNTVRFRLSAFTTPGRAYPSVVVTVNDTPVTGRVTVDALRSQSALREITATIPEGTVVRRIGLQIDGADYVSANNYSTLYVEGLTYRGTPIDLHDGRYSKGGAYDGYAEAGTGSLSFEAGALAVAGDYPAANGSTIDGGGGMNTVVYRGLFGDYTVRPQADGSTLVTAKRTPEGPDTLRRVQWIRFADDCLFDWLEQHYPQYLSPAGGTSQPLEGTGYYYRYYAATGNYVGTNWQDRHLWLLGKASAGQLLDVGALADYLAASECAP